MTTGQTDYSKKNAAQKPTASNQNPRSGKSGTTPTEDQGARAFEKPRATNPKDIDAQRHPEEQNVDPKAYSKKKEKNLDDSPEDQKI